ncbi:oligosaccharide flippase family protein [uncultured Limimaricola sp.]|uniref:oligosaccharide flippase family protein n=1 Tax=uncultured Limimaricola sp. TaxID=2211667 RepID=UPI0030F71AF4
MARTFLFNAGSLGASRTLLALSQILVLPVVSRYLTPSEFGDMAIAMSIVVFAQMLSDAGMGRSLIRQPSYDPAEWNSVFWLLAAVGTLLTLGIAALAPVWAALFDRPALLWLVAVLSVLPFLNALTAVATAHMEREGRFPRLALIRVGAGVAGLVTVLVLAVFGAGAWSLVGQQVVIAMVQSLGTWIQSSFRPTRPHNFVPLGGHIRFATDNIGVSLLFSAQRQGPILLIGGILGAVPAGLFSMSQRFLTLPRNAIAGPVSQVVFVRIAKAQAAREEVAEIYVASCRVLAVAVFPPMAVLAGSGGSLFPFLLSDTWASASVIVALAAPGVMIDTATASVGVMLQALDRTRLRLRMIAERTLLRTIAVAIALPFGIEAVALALTLFSIAYLPRYLWFAARVAPINGSAVLSAMTIGALASAIGWVAMFYSAQFYGAWQMLGLSCATLLLTWVLAILPQMSRLHRAASILSP